MSIIKIPNYSFSIDHDKKLCPDELFVFMFLFKYKNMDDEILVTINILNSIFKFQKGNDRKNRPFIKSILLSLQSKGFIISDLHSGTDSNENISGTIINVANGYCGVDSSVFDELVDNNDLLEAKLKIYLYSYIHCYGETGRRVGFERMSEICSYFDSIKNYSVSTIQKIINDLDGKYIYRFSGEHSGSKQDANIYFTSLDRDRLREYRKHIDKKTNIKVNQTDRKSDETIHTATYGDITISRFKEIVKESNWRKIDELVGGYKAITYDDYELHRINVDENIDSHFMSLNNKSIKSMKLFPDTYNYDWEEWETQYLKDKEELETIIEEESE